MTSSSPLRVLLVEDDRMVSGVVARILELRTPNVVVLEDGLRALAALRQTSFDVVITDLRLPGSNGIEIAEWVQRGGIATEVIVISGFVREDDELAIRRAGASFLRKPFGASDLLDALDAAAVRLASRRA